MDLENAEKELEGVLSQTQNLIEDAQELINTAASYRCEMPEFSVILCKEEIVESTDADAVENSNLENNERESAENAGPDITAVEASTRLDHSYDTSSPQDVRNERLSPATTITLNESCNDDVVYVCSNVLSEGYVETIDLTSVSQPPNSKKPKRRKVVDQVDLTHSPAGPRGDGGEEPQRPELKCGVCLENMLASAHLQPMSTICGHLFCRNCIIQATKINRKCPLCCRKLNSKNFHPVYF